MATVTSFPNGIGQYVGFAKGGAAGSLAIIGGVEAGDILLKVLAAEFGTDGAISTIYDLTSEFVTPVGTSAYIDNTSGTDCTGALLIATFVDKDAGE